MTETSSYLKMIIILFPCTANRYIVYKLILYSRQYKYLMLLLLAMLTHGEYVQKVRHTCKLIGKWIDRGSIEEWNSTNTVCKISQNSQIRIYCKIHLWPTSILVYLKNIAIIFWQVLLVYFGSLISSFRRVLYAW